MGKISQYEVRLASLSTGKYERDYKCDTTLFRDMENDEVTGCDVDVHVTIEHRSDVYTLTFLCRGTLQVPCDRCLDDMDIPVDTSYTMTVEYGDAYDESGDDKIILPQSQTTLDIAPVIYSTLMLCIPLHKTHGEGECNPEMLRHLGEHTVESGPEEEETPEE